jgi:hydroxysqualene synthase
MTTAIDQTLETPSGKNAATENFPVGSFLLRKSLRPHIHAFYRFARAADDIADHPLMEPAEKVARLERFDSVLLGAEDPAYPAASAMRATLAAIPMPPHHCQDLLIAFKRDATKLRYRDWSELMEYCRYSAAPVGRFLLDLHGANQTAWPANDALCAALQIINHLQDCADDYRELDRVYLPEDLAEAVGADFGMLAQAETLPPLWLLFHAALDRVAPLLQEARALPRQIPAFRLRMEAAIIVALAEALAKRLRRRDPLKAPVKLGRLAIGFAIVRGLLFRLF